MTHLFTSDNGSAAHPAVLQALLDLPRDHYTSYGADPITARAEAAIQELFGADCAVLFVYNGTGANVTALRTMARSYHGVICTHMAHINEDEAGACEAIGGFKLLTVDRPNGKLLPADLPPFLARRGFEHANQPAALSLTQATEVGTVYTPSELRALTDAAHAASLLVHVDGARIANAAVSITGAGLAGTDETAAVRAALRAITIDAGIDALSFGATKNGLAFGEAVVFFNRALVDDVRYLRKQNTQLHSKMRYIAGQFLAYLTDDLWVRNARHANEMATQIARELAMIDGWKLAHPVEANGVFVHMPQDAIAPLQREFGFYLWNEPERVARLMMSYDTPIDFVRAFVARARALAAR